jgi:hypothetical protein
MQHIIRNYNIGVAVVLAAILCLYLIRLLRKKSPTTEKYKGRASKTKDDQN